MIPIIDKLPTYDKRIIVTGAAGFIASHLAIRFVQNYPNNYIVTYDKLDYCASMRNLDSIKDAPNHKFIKGDLLDYTKLKSVLMEEKIDHIVHLAAQTHVDNSFGNALTFTENNVLGTHTLLEAARECGNIVKFVHCSTDEVYGTSIDKDEPSGEDAALMPTNPYAASKLAAECIVKSYLTSYNIPIIITRGNNVYGTHQFPEKLIPKFIIRLLKGQKLCMHGNGSNKRTYLYVDDMARAFDVVLHKGEIGKVYNVAGPHEYTNLDVSKLLLSMMKPDEDPMDHIEFVDDRPFNDVRYNIQDNAIRALGWRYDVQLDEGLRRTVNWYIENWQTHWDQDITTALLAHTRMMGDGNKLSAITLDAMTD